MLERYGMNPAETSPEDLKKRLAGLERTRTDAAAENKKLQKILKELTAKQETLATFLHIREEEKETEKKKAREEETTRTRRRKKKGQEI